MRRRLPLLAALGGLAVLAVVLAVVLGRDDVRTTGSNNEFGRPPAARIPGGRTVCQAGEDVPVGTGAVRVIAEGPPPVALAARVRVGPEVVEGPPVRWDGAPRAVDLPLGRVVAEEVPGADVCIANLGTTEVGFFGYGRSGRLSGRVDGAEIRQRVRITYVRPGAESWARTAPRVLERMGTARGSLLGGWAGYGAIAAGLALCALVLAAIHRELRP